MRAVVFALLVCGVSALDNGLGRTPAMGYNTWNDFRCGGINAANIMKVADTMAALKLASHGYEYLNIDDCWATARDNVTHQIIPDPQAFSQGMKAVADYVHSKGFKFGIYTDRGDKTCAGRPASLGYEDIDAQTYASWGVDYLKEDSCHASSDKLTAFSEYATMRDALNKTGRPIYFSLCGWNPWYAPVGADLGNSWRISSDVNGYASLWNSARLNSQLGQFAGPGSWNDPDMLVGSSPNAAVHNTPDQARTQFSLWSVMASPLLIGSNILNLTAYDLETYTNDEVIAVNQDPKGIQGRVAWENCPITSLEQIIDESGNLIVEDSVPNCQQVWAKPLYGGKVALLMVNWGTDNATITCDSDCLKRFGMSGSVSVRDLWSHSDLGVVDPLTFTVTANGASRTFLLEEQTGRRAPSPRAMMP